jgi:hypothetical protein
MGIEPTLHSTAGITATFGRMIQMWIVKINKGLNQFRGLDSHAFDFGLRYKVYPPSPVARYDSRLHIMCVIKLI